MSAELKVANECKVIECSVINGFGGSIVPLIWVCSLQLFKVVTNG